MRLAEIIKGSECEASSSRNVWENNVPRIKLITNSGSLISIEAACRAEQAISYSGAVPSYISGLVEIVAFEFISIVAHVHLTIRLAE